MKETIEVQEVVTKTKIVKRTCDICEKNINGKVIWGIDPATITCRITPPYKSLEYSIIEMDCCDTCFIERVRPLLEREFNITLRQEYSKHYPR